MALLCILLHFLSEQQDDMVDAVSNCSFWQGVNHFSCAVFSAKRRESNERSAEVDHCTLSRLILLAGNHLPTKMITGRPWRSTPLWYRQPIPEISVRSSVFARLRSLSYLQSTAEPASLQISSRQCLDTRGYRINESSGSI